MWTVVEQLKEIGRVEGKAEGREEGRAEGMTEVICNMYHNGMKISEISKSTNIPQSRLRRMVAKKKEQKV